ncbi:MAG: DNA-deoxyinosine glycosylase [Mariprofundus sp.]|nr:DNA-deoxyinosine glycosylase [Mariprofundus sp.]
MNDKQMPDIGFPYVAQADARVLILGSMPSRKSLTQQQYYAHPQNAFWPLMSELLDFPADLVYALRLKQLLAKRIALWDVAHACVRQGSLDQAIAMDTVVANDFAAFFAQHRDIRTIFFNGRKAEQVYRKLVLRQLDSHMQSIATHLLPSTSPAHASMNRAEKYLYWSIVKKTLESQ